MTKLDKDALPNGLLIEDQTLTLSKKYKQTDTITLKLSQRNQTKFNLVVEESVEAKVIIELIDNDTSDVTYNLNIDLKANSQVKFLILTEIQSKNASLKLTSMSQADSNLEFIGGFINDVMDARLNFDLVGKGAGAKVRTITVSSKDHEQKLDIHMIHHAPYTAADMTNVGIAGQNGIIRLNGVGEINQGMVGSAAFQTLKGVITNDAAQIDVNPILIIDEHDVTAGHAATVGKMEEEVLFYLRSRGITLEDAQRLIIHGYLQPIIDEIDDELIKENVLRLVNERI